MKPKLQYLSRGAAVTELQSLLNQLMPAAMPKLVPDGKFGDKTLKRVREFQASRGLVADGIVGGKTWAAIDGKAPPKPGAHPPPSPSPALTHHPKGIGDGAPLKCTFGSGSSSLRIPGLPRPACVSDCKAYANIPTFGMCISSANPQVQAMTMAAQMSMPPGQAAKAGNSGLSPAPCMPVIAGFWIAAGGPKAELVGNPPQPALTKTSILLCQWGGTIKIA